MNNWRDSLEDYQRARIEQVENYAKKFGYQEDSDQELMAILIERLDTAEWMKQKLYEVRPFWVKWIDRLIERNRKKFDGYHPYTCYLFRRVDWLILWLQGKKPHWNKGYLIVGFSEAKMYIPPRFYSWAADMQNRHYWTRIILDW